MAILYMLFYMSLAIVKGSIWYQISGFQKTNTNILVGHLIGAQIDLYLPINASLGRLRSLHRRMSQSTSLAKWLVDSPSISLDLIYMHLYR